MPPRCRVLMLAACPFPTAGGTQALIRRIAAELSASGAVEVHLVTYAFGEGEVGAFDRGEPYTIHRALPAPGHRRLAAGPSWGRPVADALLVGAALRLARRPGFALLHAHNYEGALAAALVSSASGLPWVYHAHNLMGEELETYCAPGSALAWASRGFGRLLDRAVPRLADRSIAVNPWTAAALRRCGARHVAVIPPAIDALEGGELASPGADVVYAGNLDGYQGLEAMLRGWRLLASRRPQTRFALVTADPAPRAAALLQAAGLEGAVEVAHPARPAEVAPWLRAASVAVLPRVVPSGFPIKLLNYLHAGCPVVACAGGAQGLDEASGVVSVPDGDAEALALALADVLDDPARRAALSACAARAAQGFSGPAVTRAILDVYDDLLAGTPR